MRAASKRAAWYRRYFTATFGSWDARWAAVAFGATFSLTASSALARGTGGALLPVTAGICAGILGIVLTAMAVVTAFITRGFVAMVQDIEEAMEPFATVARVAAGGIVVSLAGLVSSTSAWPWFVALLLAASVAGTIWATLGVIDLVKHTIFFAWVRSQEVHTLIEAEQIREARLREVRKSSG